MKQATIEEHRLAVAVLAGRSATKAVKARLKAQGVQLTYVPARDIAALARDYFAQNWAFFIVEAKQAIATYPEFARWRINDRTGTGMATRAALPRPRGINWS